MSRAPRTRRRLTCRDCGETFAADRRNFYVKGYVNGNRRQPKYDSYCRPCRRERTRQWVERQREDPEKAARLREYHRIKRAEYRRANPARERAYNVARWQEIKADERAHAELLARRRAYAEDQRLRERIHAGKELSPEVVRDLASRGPLLDAAPLGAWLALEFGAWSPQDVGLWLGIDGTTVRRLINGDTREVSLSFADRVLIAADCPHLLNLLYPPDQGQGMAA